MGKRLVKLICSILCVTLLLMGCQSDEPMIQETKEVYYLADYQNVEVGCNVNDLCVFGDKAYFVGNVGSITEADLQTTVKVLNMSDFSIDVLPISFAQNEYVSALTVSDGKLYFVKQSISLNDDKTEIEESDYTLCIYDVQGNEELAADISNDIRLYNNAGEVSYITGIEVDKEENIVLTDRINFLLVYDKEGKMRTQMPYEGMLDNLLTDEEGNVYCVLQKEGVSGSTLSMVDLETRNLNEILTNIQCYDNEISFLSDENMYFSNKNMFQRTDIKTQETQEVWDWTKYGFATNDIKGVYKLSEDTFFAYATKTQNGSMIMETVRFIQSDVPPEGKKVITYATFGLDDMLMEKAVADFNRQSREYQVEIVDYTDDEYSSLGNFEEKLLNSEMADVINLDGCGNFYSYANKGLFADLNTMFEKDENISREDYFSNVLEGYEIEGKLYMVPVRFQVETAVGKADVWGEKTTVSMDELLEMSKENPKMDFLGYNCHIKSLWLSETLCYRMEEYVDFETGECYFDSEKFVKELQFANCFMEEYEPYLWEENQLEEIAGCRSGNIFIAEEERLSVESIQQLKGIYDDEIVFVGYPGNSDNKGTIKTDILLGIYEDSKNKEGAWEFISFLLSKEYQETLTVYRPMYNIPLHKEVFEAAMQKAMEPNIHKNLDGEEEEVEKIGYYYGENKEIYVPIYHSTKEEVDMYYDVVTNATVRRWDLQIIRIADEESQAYFSGQKSAEDVANIIQKRVYIYLGEQQ